MVQITTKEKKCGGPSHWKGIRKTSSICRGRNCLYSNLQKYAKEKLLKLLHEISEVSEYKVNKQN